MNANQIAYLVEVQILRGVLKTEQVTAINAAMKNGKYSSACNYAAKHFIGKRGDDMRETAVKLVISALD